MPRKKLSPSNRSIENDSYLEGTESDSSLEFDSRRNTYRKKPQRKCLKQRQNDSLESTVERQRCKLQENSSEENEKRPRIIKIFRRIDRKAKHIYLVDDKVDNWNEIGSPTVSKDDSHVSYKKQTSLSEEPTCVITMFKSSGEPLRKLREYSTKPDEIDSKKLEDVDEWNLSGDDDTYSSSTSTGKTTDESGIDFQKHSFNANYLYSPVTDSSETSHGDGTSNTPCNMHDLYSPLKDVSVTLARDKNWNRSFDTDGLYSPVTHVSQATDRYYTCNKPCSTKYDLYSPVNEFVQACTKNNILNQQCDANDFYSLVTDIAHKHCKVDIWSQPRDIETLYPSETDTDQTSSRDSARSRRVSSGFDSPNSWETDIDQTPNNDNICNQQLDSGFYSPNSWDMDTEKTSSRDNVSWNLDAPNSSETNVGHTYDIRNVCSRRLSGELDSLESSLKIEQSLSKYQNFDFQHSDSNIFNEDENFNIKSVHFNSILNNDHNTSYLLERDNDFLSV